MLTSLYVENIVLIERIHLDFRKGNTVFTGETGAGKSIVLDALSLALGARGDSALVRQGCEAGQVVAAFEVHQDHPASHYLKELGPYNLDEDLVLKRVQSKDGRSKAFINNQPVSASQLKTLGMYLVEIHGQHDERALVDTQKHLQLLDDFGELSELCKTVSTHYQNYSNKQKELQRAQAKLEAAREEEDYIRYASNELAKIDPQPGEEAELDTRRAAMMQAEKIAADVQEAYESLSGPSSPMPEIMSLMRRLERKVSSPDDALNMPLAFLNDGIQALSQAETSLQNIMQQMDYNPTELEAVEERLFGLRALARKHNCQVEQLPALREAFLDQLEQLQSGSDNCTSLEQELETAKTVYHEHAEKLSIARNKTGVMLEKAVNSELPALKLAAARFMAEISQDPLLLSSNGYDQVSFNVQTNPGSRPGPIMKVASGGELSRFLLALKVALAQTNAASTLIFDEIDSGVGGAVAEAIGQRLAILSERVQVISVTHAPQVAALADTHFLIEKSDKQDLKRDTSDIGQPQDDKSDNYNHTPVITEVRSLNQAERREEIARMLAGAVITNEARAAADQLMASPE